MKLHRLTSSLLLPSLALAHAPHLLRSQTQQPFAGPPPDIPLLGFGTWNLHNSSEAVSVALQAGYRHIDAAAAYGNEVQTGEGIRDGLNKTGLERGDIWVTSKLWNSA